MRLRDYHCVRLGIECKIPYDTHFWGKMIKFFAAKKGIIKRKGRATAIRAVLESIDKDVDYHYHFSADRSSKKRKKTVHLDISLHADKSVHKGRTSRLDYEVPELELWLHDLFGKSIQGHSIRIDWDARFVFDKRSFSSVFPMPFKSPFEIPRGKSLMGEVSISGLKLKIDKSVAGLETIYIEAFPEIIVIGTIFNQKTVLRAGIVEHFLRNAATVARLFIKEEQNHEIDKA